MYDVCVFIFDSEELLVAAAALSAQISSQTTIPNFLHAPVPLSLNSIFDSLLSIYTPFNSPTESPHPNCVFVNLDMGVTHVCSVDGFTCLSGVRWWVSYSFSLLFFFVVFHAVHPNDEGKVIFQKQSVNNSNWCSEQFL